MSEPVSEQGSMLTVEQVFSQSDVVRIQQGEVFLDGRGINLANNPNWLIGGVLKSGVGKERRLSLEFQDNTSREPRPKWLISSKSLAGVGYDQRAGVLWIQSMNMGFNVSDMARGQKRKFGIRVSSEMKENERILLEYLLGFVLNDEDYAVRKNMDLNQEVLRVLGQRAMGPHENFPVSQVASRRVPPVAPQMAEPRVSDERRIPQSPKGKKKKIVGRPNKDDLVIEPSNPESLGRVTEPQPAMVINLADLSSDELRHLAKAGVKSAQRFLESFEKQEEAREKREKTQAPSVEYPEVKQSARVIKEGLIASKAGECLVYYKPSDEHPDDYQDQWVILSRSGGLRVGFADGVSTGSHVTGYTGSQSAREGIEGVVASNVGMGSLSETLMAFQDGAGEVSCLGTGTTLGVLDILPNGQLFLAQQGTEMVYIVREDGEVELINDPDKVNEMVMMDGKKIKATNAVDGLGVKGVKYQNRVSFNLRTGDWVVVMSDYASERPVEEIKAVLSQLAKGANSQEVANGLFALRGLRSDGTHDDVTNIFIPSSAWKKGVSEDVIPVGSLPEFW